MAKRSNPQTKIKDNLTGVSVERCLNPWDNNCENTNIAIYIMYKGRRIPLCWKCWKKISKSDIVWEAY